MSNSKLSYKDIKENYFNYNGDSNTKYSLDLGGFKITISRYISIREMITFVNDVVKSCFAIDTGEYLPEIKEFSIRCSILETYGNIELPESLDEKYNFVYRSGLVEQICKHIDKEQLKDIVKSINNKIDYKLKSNIKAVESQIDGVIKNLNEIQENIINAFDGLDKDTVLKTYSAIVNGKLDEGVVNELMNNVHEVNEVKSNSDDK